MEYEFTHQPSFTQLTVTLEAGESVVAAFASLGTVDVRIE